MQRAHAFELGRECRMVGGVVAGGPGGDLRWPGRLALAPDRPAVEVGGRAEAGGVLAGVEAFVVRRAVGVDQVAVEGRAHGGRAVEEAAVQAVDVPVGVGERLPGVVQAGGDLPGQPGAGVRHREDDRRLAALDLDRIHPPSPGKSAPDAASSAPSRTSAAAASRSGARKRSSPSGGTSSRRRARAAASGGLVVSGARNSMPWAAQSASMPRMRSRFADHRGEPPRAVGGHRDVVLLVGAGRGRVGGAGGGEVLVLAHQRRGGDLGDHEAGVEAGLAVRNGGRS